MAATARDSLLPVRIVWNTNNQDKAIATQLVDIESGYSVTGDHRKAFSRLLNIAKARSIILNRRVRLRLFNDLAGVSARLRLYPIAMKCYFNAGRAAGLPDPEGPDINETDLPDDSAFYRGAVTVPSTPVKIETILSSFEDRKDAASYAILVQVKQPAPGKRKSFTGINNVGHMFITLIKYNRDNSIVSRSFGFYPHKSSLFSATPIHPGSPGVIKDDSGHDWDEIAGKFISLRRFRRIIETLQSYDHTAYNLNRNNCTDFGLTMARLGGITIGDTRGRWPLGKGSNPGSAGQSILEGKISNADEDYAEPLFVSNNNVACHR